MTNYEKSPFAADDQRIFKIEIPELKQTKMIKLNLNGTIKTTCDVLALKLKLQFPEDYGFEVQNLMLDPQKHLAFYNFPDQSLLRLKKRLQRITVKICVQDATRVISVPVSITGNVSDLRNEIKKHAQYNLNPQQEEKFALFLRSSENLIGTRLEEQRRLSGYRLKPEDIIEFKEIPRDQLLDSQVQFIQTPEILFVRITSSLHGITKTFKLTLLTTIGEAMTLFISKNPVNQISKYGMKYYGKSKTKKSDLYPWLDLGKTLAQYQIPNMGVLHLKRKDPNLTPTRRSETRVFGVPPVKLPVISDSGLPIPEPLYFLKQALIRHGGLQCVEIFKRPGNEETFRDIRNQLNLRTFKDSSDVYALASLIKRWYGDLPVKVLGPLTPLQLERGASHEVLAVSTIDRLPEDHQLLFYWLLDLVCQISLESNVNKMTSRSLAISIGPNLYDSSADPHVDAIQVTRWATDILYLNVMNKLKEVYGKAPSSGNDLLRANPYDDDYSQIETEENQTTNQQQNESENNNINNLENDLLITLTDLEEKLVVGDSFVLPSGEQLPLNNIFAKPSSDQKAPMMRRRPINDNNNNTTTTTTTTNNNQNKNNNNGNSNFAKMTNDHPEEDLLITLTQLEEKLVVGDSFVLPSGETLPLNNIFAKPAQTTTTTTTTEAPMRRRPIVDTNTTTTTTTTTNNNNKTTPTSPGKQPLTQSPQQRANNPTSPVANLSPKPTSPSSNENRNSLSAKGPVLLPFNSNRQVRKSALPYQAVPKDIAETTTTTTNTNTQTTNNNTQHQPSQRKLSKADYGQIPLNPKHGTVAPPPTAVNQNKNQMLWDSQSSRSDSDSVFSELENALTELSRKQQ